MKTFKVNSQPIIADLLQKRQHPQLTQQGLNFTEYAIEATGKKWSGTFQTEGADKESTAVNSFVNITTKFLGKFERIIKASIDNRNGNTHVYKKPFFMRAETAKNKILKFIETIQPEIIAQKGGYTGDGAVMASQKTGEAPYGFKLLQPAFLPLEKIMLSIEVLRSKCNVG